jgi:hypothetical protein
MRKHAFTDCSQATYRNVISWPPLLAGRGPDGEASGSGGRQRALAARPPTRLQNPRMMTTRPKPMSHPRLSDGLHPGWQKGLPAAGKPPPATRMTSRTLRVRPDRRQMLSRRSWRRP